MKVELQQGNPWSIEADALIVGAVEGGEHQPPWTIRANQALGGKLAALIADGLVRGDVGEVVPVTADGVAARYCIVVGLGAPATVDAERLRQATGHAVRWLEAHGLETAVTLLPLGLSQAASAERVAAVAEAAVLASFRTTTFGEKGAAETPRNSRHVLVDPRKGRVAELHRAVTRGAAFGAAANEARRLAELPSNHLTPTGIGKEATRLLKNSRVSVTVHDEAWIRKRGMGGLLGVGQGSSEPSRFIVMEYKPARAKKHVVLVGKGISFDTGGISLKPREGMERMKYDMGGAAAVIGTMVAVSRLGSPHRVTGLVPTAENMPDGGAIKPGDVLLTASGKSVEVLNTDAEGRLVLADGLDFGRRLQPDCMIDVATLTGACKIALGDVACGLMGNDERLIDAIAAAGRASGEWAWHLPLTEVHAQAVRSKVADLRNSTGRWGASLTAAAFLRPFAGDTPWAHLDIAGVGWLDRDLGYITEGPSGFGVRLLATFLDAG